MVTEDWTVKSVPIKQINDLLKQGYQVEVDSPDGWVKVELFVDKGKWPEFVLNTANGHTVRCNENHLFETTLGWLSAKDIVHLQHYRSAQVHVLTAEGWSEADIVTTDKSIPIVDIRVDHPNHRYYTEGVSSHNTGVGKSLFMCHVAASVLSQGKNVLYITLEMAEERIAERIDANLMNVTLDDLKDLPRPIYENRIRKLLEGNIGKLIIKEYPTSGAHAGHFKSLLKELQLKRDFRPDIIVIDYLNICSSSRFKAGANINSYTLVKSIAEELRGLAVENNVPILSATQTTRSGYGNTEVELTDTSESFGLPATVDFMFALITTEDLEALNQLMVKQLKNRYNDPTINKKFVIGVDRARMRLYDLERNAQQNISNSGIKIAEDKLETATVKRVLGKIRDFSSIKI